MSKSRRHVTLAIPIPDVILTTTSPLHPRLSSTIHLHHHNQTTTMPAPSAAPWKPLLSHHLSLIKPPTFTLATLSTSPSPTNPNFPPSSPTEFPPIPRLRTMIHRGFLGTIPDNPHNTLATLNPPHAYTSDLLTFTTDARSTKAPTLAAGAPIEACYWIAGDTTTGEDVQNQWRVRGRCFLLSESDPETTETTGALQPYMRPGDADSGVHDWHWPKEVLRHWGNLAPSMRGSFANPPPGVPLEEWPSGKDGLVKGRKVENAELLKRGEVETIALRNFRLGVMVPEIVERVDLNADGKTARRWVWWRVNGGWEERETWP
ncbi:pyridoxamine 5'-phosphate oxidase-domain-containing protein [Geopyxis carbonaria]|nr:pyridoxamine 5'-phosphate oxidase-domain-containing protein [Geopyxis carbonaria]